MRSVKFHRMAANKGSVQPGLVKPWWVALSSTLWWRHSQCMLFSLFRDLLAE